MLRKVNFKKAQKSNLKKLTETNKLEKTDREKKVDEALLAKVGIASKTKEQLKNLQETLPIGGNMYFELNRIAYKNDIERRKRKIEERYDYGLNVSCF